MSRQFRLELKSLRARKRAAESAASNAARLVIKIQKLDLAAAAAAEKAALAANKARIIAKAEAERIDKRILILEGRLAS